MRSQKGDGSEITEAKNFRDLTGLSKLLKISLVVYMALVVCKAIVATGNWFQAQGGAHVTEAEAAASDSRQTLLGALAALEALSFLITAFIFLRWTYLSNRNARVLGAADMKFTPGWAVGWYFVPIAWLWKPYQALKEIFKASHPDYAEDWWEAPHPRILPLWWTLWILHIRVAGRAHLLPNAFLSDRPEVLLFLSYLDMLDVPLGIVVILLVSKLQEWQLAKYRRVVSAAP
jgi:hypothetical protein